jgi:hypothetical protein
MTLKRRKKMGRPPHLDDPPISFATTLSESTIARLTRLHEQLGRPRSEIIAKALQVYEQMQPLLKS